MALALRAARRLHLLELLARRVILGELGLGGVTAAAVLIFRSVY